MTELQQVQTLAKHHSCASTGLLLVNLFSLFNKLTRKTTRKLRIYMPIHEVGEGWGRVTVWCGCWLAFLCSKGAKRNESVGQGLVIFFFSGGRLATKTMVIIEGHNILIW
jgi:hypothetical protein